MTQPHPPVLPSPRRSHPIRRARSWRPAEVAALVVAACYGAATVMMATAVFLRLIR